MYIISKKRDYWDGCAMSYGIDKSRTIERKDQQVHLKDRQGRYTHTININPRHEKYASLKPFERTAEVSNVLVNFYHGPLFFYVILKYVTGQTINHKDKSVVETYEDQVFPSYLQAEIAFNQLRGINIDRPARFGRLFSPYWQGNESGEVTFERKGYYSYLDEILEEHKAPYCAASSLVEDGTVLTLNPVLCDKAYRFDKMSPAFNTYQLVDAAMSELLTKIHEGKLVDIVEPDIIYKAGHDPKVSFRHRKKS